MGSEQLSSLDPLHHKKAACQPKDLLIYKNSSRTMPYCISCGRCGIWCDVTFDTMYTLARTYKITINAGKEKLINEGTGAEFDPTSDDSPPI